MTGRLYAGVAGFSYPAWRGSFYPADAKPEDFLRLYAERLPAVELVGVFYRLPSEAQLRRWAEQTPREFRFGVKMTRDISQGGRLERLATFAERMRALGDRLGAVRIQLPPTRPRDDGFLTLLLGSLDPSLRVALEATHESWSHPEVESALAATGAVRVNALDAKPPFRYLRLRDVPYGDDELEELAERIRPLLADGVDVYAFFLHEDEPRGTRYAQRLLELTGTSAAPPPPP
jgi:uncharacterized protein YecE (DUF72 family)